MVKSGGVVAPMLHMTPVFGTLMSRAFAQQAAVKSKPALQKVTPLKQVAKKVVVTNVKQKEQPKLIVRKGDDNKGKKVAPQKGKDSKQKGKEKPQKDTKKSTDKDKDKEKEKEKLLKEKEKEKALKEKEREKALKEKEKEKEKALKEKEKEKANKGKEKESEKDKSLERKEKEKEKKEREKEKKHSDKLKQQEAAKRLKEREQARKSREQKRNQEFNRKKSVKAKIQKKKKNHVKRVRSPFNFFVAAKSKEIMAKNNLSMIDAMKHTSEAWKKLSDDQKKEYVKLSNEDLVRRKTEAAEVKSHQPPKRPLTAYAVFVKQFLSNSKHTVAVDGMREAAGKWKAFTPEQKKTYEQQRAALAKKYESALAEYKKKEGVEEKQ